MLRTRVKAGPVPGLVMSLLFAVVLTAVHMGDHYVSLWAPAMGAATPVTLRVPFGPRLTQNQAGRADLRHGHARTVVPRGTVLRTESSVHWTAYLYESVRRPPELPRLAGVFSIFFTLAMALTAYLRNFGQSRLRLLRVQVGLLMMLGTLAVGAKAMLLFTSLPEFWIPVASVPLWIAASFDRRTAFLIAVVMAFIIAALLDLDLVFLCVMLARGMSATLLYFDRKHSRSMVLSGFLGGVAASLVYVAIVVTFDGRYDIIGDLLRLPESPILACLGGGILGGVLGAVGRNAVARVLGEVPRDRLVDLSDLEQPLLVRLSKEAPGTYEHSRAMANLAEQAASAIGANALLTRVGAYYHDLGKSAQAKYFVENLGPDERSPHDELDPETSADAIMAHVVLGTKILRDGGLPEPVVEFAYTHHGTQLVEYFWNKCLQAGNPNELTEDAFRYPGMKPQTKETAIVMVVDSIEAASRTIDPPERSSFEHMVQRVMFTKLATGQLDDSGLEMPDLRVIVTRMVDTLVNMHHHRIKYQWQAQRAEEFGVPSTAVRDSVPDIEIHATATEHEPPDSAGADASMRVAPLPEVAPVPEVPEVPKGEGS
jgi:hypothetical protein